MPRKKKVAEVQVAENVSLVFLQRRYEQLLVDMNAMRERGIVEIPCSSASEDLRARVQELENQVSELEESNISLVQEKTELAERLESEESRNVELEGEKEELENQLEERYQLLVKAQRALRSVLGREDLEDSLEKYNAFRVLDDITDEVG